MTLCSGFLRLKASLSCREEVILRGRRDQNPLSGPEGGVTSTLNLTSPHVNTFDAVAGTRTVGYREAMVHLPGRLGRHIYQDVHLSSYPGKLYASHTLLFLLKNGDRMGLILFISPKERG